MHERETSVNPVPGRRKPLMTSVCHNLASALLSRPQNLPPPPGACPPGPARKVGSARLCRRARRKRRAGHQGAPAPGTWQPGVTGAAGSCPRARPETGTGHPQARGPAPAPGCQHVREPRSSRAFKETAGTHLRVKNGFPPAVGQAPDTSTSSHLRSGPPPLYPGLRVPQCRYPSAGSSKQPPQDQRPHPPRRRLGAALLRGGRCPVCAAPRASAAVTACVSFLRAETGFMGVGVRRMIENITR